MEKLNKLRTELTVEFGRLQPQVIRPAEGYLKYPFLVWAATAHWRASIIFISPRARARAASVSPKDIDAYIDRINQCLVNSYVLRLDAQMRGRMNTPDGLCRPDLKDAYIVGDRPDDPRRH